VSVAYRRVTPNYAQVSVRHLPRDSNPQPSEPQSADACFQALLYVAESA
jgi:hypothetical protein